MIQIINYGNINFYNKESADKPVVTVHMEEPVAEPLIVAENLDEDEDAVEPPPPPAVDEAALTWEELIGVEDVMEEPLAPAFDEAALAWEELIGVEKDVAKPARPVVASFAQELNLSLTNAAVPTRHGSIWTTTGRECPYCFKNYRSFNALGEARIGILRPECTCLRTSCNKTHATGCCPR